MEGQSHIPVLLNEVLAALQPKAGEIYVDATFGGGGYTRAIVGAAPCQVIAIDRDDDAIKRGHALRAALNVQGRDAFWKGEGSVRADPPSTNPVSTDPVSTGAALHLAHGPFSHMESYLDQLAIPCVDAVIFDLGVSSFHLDEGDRGFSFRFDAPLAMTMGCNTYTAYDVVNECSEEELSQLLWEGEEKFARRIAKKIVATRMAKPIATTFELADLVASCKPKRFDGIHQATIAFQAIRMHVNEELAELKKALHACKTRLKAGGRLIVVTFHSLEDRIVKQFMREESGWVARPSRHLPLEAERLPASFELIQKKSIQPSQHEQSINPRARSARLRVAHRTTYQACSPQACSSDGPNGGEPAV